MSTPLDLLRSSIVLDVDLRTGSYRDRGPNAIAVTPVAGCTWSVGECGWGLRFNSTGMLSVADNAAIRPAEATVIVLRSGAATHLSGERYVSARGAGGINYEVYASADNTLAIACADAAAKTLAISAAGKRLLVAQIKSGTASTFRLDGHQAGTGANCTALGTTAQALMIGNLYTGANPCAGLIHRVIVLNTGTPSTHALADLYAYLMDQRMPTDACLLSPMPQPEMQLRSSSVVAALMCKKQADGKIADAAPYQNVATPVVGSVFGGGSKAIPEHGLASGGATIADSASLRAARSQSMTAWCSPSADATQTILDRGTNDALAYLANGVLRVDKSGGAQVGFSALDLRDGQTHCVQTYYDSASQIMRVVEDGEDVTSNTSAVALTASNGTHYLWENAAGANKFTGVGHTIHLTNAAETPVTLRREYVRRARVATRRYDMRAVPVTIAALTVAANPISTSPWVVGSGQWSVIDEPSVPRGLKCVAAGHAYARQTYASLSCRATMRAPATGIATLMFCASTNLAPGTATQNGYGVRMNGTSLEICKFAGVTVTVLATLAGAIAANVWHDVHIAKHSIGVANSFKAWVRAKGARNWSPVCQAADVTYTSSQFACFASDTADARLADFVTTVGPVYPNELSIGA